jgi:hypothetical protein
MRTAIRSFSYRASFRTRGNILGINSRRSVYDLSDLRQQVAQRIQAKENVSTQPSTDEQPRQENHEEQPQQESYLDQDGSRQEETEQIPPQQVENESPGADAVDVVSQAAVGDTYIADTSFHSDGQVLGDANDSIVSQTADSPIAEGEMAVSEHSMEHESQYGDAWDASLPNDAEDSQSYSPSFEETVAATRQVAMDQIIATSESRARGHGGRQSVPPTVNKPKSAKTVAKTANESARIEISIGPSGSTILEMKAIDYSGNTTDETYEACERIQKILVYRFRNKSWLLEALSNDSKSLVGSRVLPSGNGKLALIGDALIRLILHNSLYEICPRGTIGVL